MITKQELIEKIQSLASERSSWFLCQAYHRPENEARPICCFQNVWAKVGKDSGGILFGWTFCYRVHPEYGKYLIATHHAVWHAPDKKLIDVTPFTDNPQHHPITLNGHVLFVVDELAQPVDNGTLVAPLPLKFFAIDDNQKLREYVAKLSDKEQKACQEIYNGNVNPAQISGIFVKPQ